MQTKVFFFLIILTIVFSCGKDPVGDLTDIEYNPDNYVVELPPHFPALVSPADNPLTHQGILLGRHLFFDPILSADSTMSCATCHLPSMAFADGKAVSTGIDGIAGKRSSMSLINIGFVKSGLFWDGRVKTLEEQALLPVEDPIEMHNTWPKVIDKLVAHPKYPRMFREAFGISDKKGITKELAAKAIAQFERIIISKDAKYDRVIQGKEKFTDRELIGFGIYFDEDPDLPDAECGHCHNTPLATSDDFFNNGLQESPTLLDFKDKGRGLVTKSIGDNGKFRAPSLRNIRYTAPYMHDGRLATLDDVLNHYISGGKESPNADPLLHVLQLDQFYKECLIAFIDTFEDTLFFNKPELQSPFK
ncbi:MAG: hypothetical protein IPM42_02950 [Saprospiraceae bacterium]|nr:hypothetical protein [Saprospiraceae bacterium]